MNEEPSKEIKLESIRSFVAFDIESETILKRIAELQVLLMKTGADLKIVEPKNIHITVRFLGNITFDTVEKVFEEMKKIRFTPFNVNVLGVGAFPNARHPRVVWAGMTEGVDQLRSVFNQLEPNLRMLGFSPDSKGFSPHFTFARVKSARSRTELHNFLLNNVDCRFGVFKATCLKLKKSVLTPKGPIYSTVREVCPEK
jgi:2'-5' RNA ligase